MTKNYEDAGVTTIDITPAGCKTPEGAARVKQTMDAFEESHAQVANAATEFYRNLTNCYTYEEFREVMDDEGADLKTLIERRSKAQDNFLRAVTGR